MEDNIKPKEKISFKKSFRILIGGLLILLGIVSAIFLKNCWPAVLFALTSWLVISSQTLGEEVKARGSFENTWSIVLTVVGVVGLVLLYTSTSYGKAIYWSFFEIMFMSSGNWEDITLHESVTSIIMAILLSLSMAASKVHWKQSVLQFATILVLFIVASAFSDSKNPTKSIPEDLGLVSYQSINQGIAGDSTTTEKKEVLNPKIQKGVNFAVKWKRAGLVLFAFFVIVFFFVKKLNKQNKSGLLKLIGIMVFFSSSIWLFAIIGQKEEFENLLKHFLGGKYPLWAALILTLTTLGTFYFSNLGSKVVTQDWWVNIFEEPETKF